MTDDTLGGQQRMPLTDRIRLGSAIGKDVFSLLRDASIFFLLVVVATNPGFLRSWMTSNEVDKVNLGVFELSAKASKEQAISAVDASAKAQENATRAIGRLNELAQADPSLMPRIRPILDLLRESEKAASNANKTAASAAATQQQLLPELSGWVSSNFLDADGEIAVGGTATVIPPRPLNLRSAPGTGNGTMGTLAPGTRVRIIEGPVGAWVRVKTERKQ